MKRPALSPVRLPSSDDSVLATMDAPPVLVLLIDYVVFLLYRLLLLLSLAVVNPRSRVVLFRAGRHPTVIEKKARRKTRN